jgi:hypothetical protein
MFDFELGKLLKSKARLFCDRRDTIDLGSVIDKLNEITPEIIAEFVSTVPWISAIPVEFPIMRTFQPSGSSDFIGVGIDGSQIYPDQNSPFRWGYIQAASYALTQKPYFESRFLDLNPFETQPTEYRRFGGYDQEKASIDFNRMILEIGLSRFLQKKELKGLIFFDGPVIPWIGKSISDSQRELQLFSKQLSKIVPDRFCGIVSDPKSHHLVDLACFSQNQNGLRHFRDIDLLRIALPIHSRSVRFRYISWKGKFLENAGNPIEFFYIRMNQDDFIRLEYIAKNENSSVNTFHVTLLEETQGLGYPYVLAMAHQYATVPLDISHQMHAIVRSELGLSNLRSRKEDLK